MKTHAPESPWSIREAKSKLSEVLRRARESGPQYIGKRDQCIVISREEWKALVEPSQSLSTWLATHRPGVELEIPKRGKSTSRAVPFSELNG